MLGLMKCQRDSMLDSFVPVASKALPSSLISCMVFKSEKEQKSEEWNILCILVKHDARKRRNRIPNSIITNGLMSKHLKGTL